MVWSLLLVEANGLRNGELTAIAPNTSTSLLMGSTASVTPTFSRFFIEKNQRGAIPRTVKHLKIELGSIQNLKM